MSRRRKGGISGLMRKGERVVYYQGRTWGGKQPVRAIFIEYRGKESALIEVGYVGRHSDGDKTTRVVRVRFIRPEEETL